MAMVLTTVGNVAQVAPQGRSTLAPAYPLGLVGPLTSAPRQREGVPPTRITRPLTMAWRFLDQPHERLVQKNVGPSTMTRLITTGPSPFVVVVAAGTTTAATPLA